MFAQAWAAGKPAIEALVAAGYRPSRPSAYRLTARPEIRARVDEILGRGARRAEVTAERVLRELAAIAFADIRRVVEWRGAKAHEIPRERKRALANRPADAIGSGGAAKPGSDYMRLVDSDQLDDTTAAAIAEVRQSASGGLWVRLHDKRTALLNLGKHLGMFKERIEHTGRNGGPIRDEYESLTDEELERIILEGRDGAAAKASRTH